MTWNGPQVTVIGDADEVMRSDPKESESKSATLRAEIALLREKVKTEKNNFERLSKENVPVSTRSKIKSSLQVSKLARLLSCPLSLACARLLSLSPGLSPPICCWVFLSLSL